MSSNLEQFTTCDLLKSFNEIGKHLMQVAPDKTKEIIQKNLGGTDMGKINKEADAEAKYEPEQTTPKTSVEEKKKPAETTVSENADTKMGKADCQCAGRQEQKAAPVGGDGSNAGVGGEAPSEVSPDTEADILEQILAAIEEIKALLAGSEGDMMERGSHAPDGGQMQMSDKQPEVTKTDISAEVKKALDEKFKELGIVSTVKPSESPNHPLTKGDGQKLSMDKIAKMSWNELHAALGE